MTSSTDFFQSSYDSLFKAVKDQPLNVNTAINIVTTAMQIVEKGTKLSGPEKKQLVINLITKLINDSPLSADVKNGLLLLPYSAIIDTIVAATKNQLNINAVIDDVKKGGLCGCFGKK